jgi:hypothetical protein
LKVKAVLYSARGKKSDSSFFLFPASDSYIFAQKKLGSKEEME